MSHYRIHYQDWERCQLRERRPQRVVKDSDSECQWQTCQQLQWCRLIILLWISPGTRSSPQHYELLPDFVRICKKHRGDFSGLYDAHCPHPSSKLNDSFSQLLGLLLLDPSQLWPPQGHVPILGKPTIWRLLNAGVSRLSLPDHFLPLLPLPSTSSFCTVEACWKRNSESIHS